ncbi:MAG: hypothetical protein ACYC1M_03070 [Armatimonadota bacterium]
MLRYNNKTIIYAVVLLQVVLIMYAYQYGLSRSVKPAAVSMIELSQPANQISPKWIAIADPNQKTVSIVMVGVGEKFSTHVMAITPYDKTEE